jgi:hypothetical protein
MQSASSKIQHALVSAERDVPLNLFHGLELILGKLRERFSNLGLYVSVRCFQADCEITLHDAGGDPETVTITAAATAALEEIEETLAAACGKWLSWREISYSDKRHPDLPKAGKDRRKSPRTQNWSRW